VSDEQNYKKAYELAVDVDVGIVMRDGVRLSARVYRPAAPGRYPVLLAASPYQHETDSLPHSTLFLWREVGPYQWYVEAQGYVIVHVDVRGTGLSQGTYKFIDSTEQQDLYEVVEWCGSQPWSNGRVGGYGQSYYCWSQWFMAIVNPPSLKCIVPYDGAVDIYRDVMYHGGIYCDFLPWWYQMVRVNNLHRPPGQPAGKLLPRDIAREFAEHDTYDDFWKERSPWERLDEIRVPTLSIGHWGKMALHLRGNLVGYEEITAPKRLVVTGARDVFEAHDQFDKIAYHEAEILPFYDRHLKEKPAADAAPVKLYVRGLEAYRDETEWPLKRADNRSFYLTAEKAGAVGSLNDGGLRPEPAKGEPQTAVDYPDPRWKLGNVAMGPAGPDPVARVLTFTTAPFEQDFEVTGPVVLELFLSTEAVDTDVFVKLADQAPGEAGKPGRAINMSKGWLRASHRRKDEALSTPMRPFYTHTDPQPVKPGEVMKLDIEVLPFSNLFRKGHRLRLEISNSDSPITDGLFTHQYSWFKVGRDTIHHSAAHPSRLILPVVPG
jgi:predicted acyl esterase